MASTRSSRPVSVPIKVLRSNEAPPKLVATPRPSRPAKPAPAPKAPLVLRAPESVRRRMMWWAVGGLTVMVIVGWISLWPRQFSGRSLFDSTITKIRDTFSGLNFGQKNASASEKEIRQLDQQVFPDFSN